MNNRFTFAVLPRTVRGQPLSLSGSPDGKHFLYTHGHSVIIRNFDSPQYSDVYTQHTTDVLCAKYSPSGFYVASADKAGKVRIWDTVNAEHILKNEYQPISGPIKDLAWSPDNQRMVCVGEGREKFGHVFLADTGTSNGDITGQSRPINSCDFRPARPFRIITGSEDNTAAYYEGPPFKFKGTKNEHSRYCQAVRYSPNGLFWASAGFDGKIFLYEGKDSELISEITDGKAAHAGGVYGISWSPDSKQLLSASGDKTCKLWDIETRKVVKTFEIGSDVIDQQLACLWNAGAGDKLISVSLSGNINFLDSRTSNGIEMVVQGHNKPITSLSKMDEKHVFTGDSDGRLIRWNTEDGKAAEIEGKGHTNQINSTKWTGDQLMSAGIDDTVRSVEGTKYTDFGVKLPSQPKGVDHADGLTFVATVNAVIVIKSGQIVHTESVSYEPSCLAACPKVGHVVVGEGGNNQNGVHVYKYSAGDGSLEELKTFTLLGQITCLAYSPSGSHLVVGDGNRRVTSFTVSPDGAYEKTHSREWGFHTAKVTCVAWAPGGRFIASGGLDCAVIIWSMDSPTKHFVLPSAHVQSQITGIRWMDDKTVLSVGQDGNTKVWNVTWKPE